MPEQNIISLAWDIPAFDEGTKRVIDNMLQVLDLGKQIGNTSIKLGSVGGYTELKEAVNNTNALAEAQQKLIVSQKQVETSTKAHADAAQKLTREQKLLVTATTSAEGSYKQLEAQMKLLLFQYKNLSEQERNSATGKQLQTDILEKNAQLKIFDADLGNYQRNVGNYNSSLGRLSKGLKGLGGLGLILGRALGIDPEVAEGIREAGRAIRDIQHARELQEVGLKGEAELYEQSKHKIDAFAAATDGATVSQESLATSTEMATVAETEMAAATTEAVAAKAEIVTASEAELTIEEQLAALQTKLALQIDERVASEITLADIKAINNAETLQGTVAGEANVAVTEAQVIAQEELAVATTATGTATKVLVNVLKFSGIAIAVAAIAYLIYKMVELSKAAGEAKRHQDELNEALKAGANGYEEAFNMVNKLTNEIKLAKEGFIDKTETLDEYNNTIGKTTGAVKSLDEAEQALIKNGDAYIQMMLLKAAANIALQSAAKKAFEAEEINRKAIEDFSSVKDIAAKGVGVATYGYNASGAKANVDQLAQANAAAAKLDKERKDEAVKLAKQGSKEQLDIARDFQNQAAEIAKKFHFDFFGGKDKKEKKTADEKVSIKEALDIEFELYKVAQQRKLRLLDQEANDVKNSFSQRVQFADDYRLASIDLAERTAKHEINVDRIKLSELQANFKKAKGSERNNIAIDIENEKKAIVIATAKKNDELLSIEDAFQKRQSQIVKDEQSRQLKIYEEAAKAVANVRNTQGGAIEAIRATEKASHDKLLHDKAITQEQYDKLEKKSVNENLILSLQADLRKEESLRKLALLQHQSVVDLDNAITATKAKILSAQNEDLSGKKTLTEQEKRDSIVALAKDATDAIQNLVDIGYQKEIDAIQKIIDLNNERKDQEVASINASTLSAQERAAQLIILDNAVAANNHKLLVQQNQERVKQAKFDRDMAILKILEDVAGANFKLIAEGGFAGIAAGIAVGLQATAAIAQLLAKPLPTVPAYAKGTDNHPGGPAIMGESGKERIDMPDGRSFITGGPMLMNNLPKGSKVTPLNSDMINQAMYSSMMISTAQHLQAGEKDNSLAEIRDAVYETGRMTAQAMRKQKGTSVIVNVNNTWGAYITKTVRE